MKVLLISTNTMVQPYPTYPIGIDYVMNAISRYHQVKSVDMNELKDSEALKAVLLEFCPDVIGLSIRNIDNVDGLYSETFFGQIPKLISTIRSHSKSVIVLGGSAFTMLPSEFMAELDADFGIVGEGERFLLLLRALEKKEPVSGMPGVVIGKGHVVFPEPLTTSYHLESIPEHSYLPFYLEKGGMLNLQTKRGCPFRCIYCTYPHIEGSRFRFAEPKEVARTARMLQNAGAKYLYITDSTFNGSYDHSLKIALAFKEVGLSIPWGGFFTPTRPPADYYRILADAGLMHIEFGTEALSDPILDAYRKPFRTKDVFESHREAREAGVHIAHYLMLGGPGEDERTLDETLTNTSELEKTVFFAFCGIRIYPNAPLYERALKEKQIATGANLLEPVFYYSPAITREVVSDRLKAHASQRKNWILGSHLPGIYKMLEKLYSRGFTGPLWEYLIR